MSDHIRRKVLPFLLFSMMSTLSKDEETAQHSLLDTIQLCCHNLPQVGVFWTRTANSFEIKVLKWLKIEPKLNMSKVNATLVGWHEPTTPNCSPINCMAIIGAAHFNYSLIDLCSHTHSQTLSIISIIQLAGNSMSWHYSLPLKIVPLVQKVKPLQIVSHSIVVCDVAVDCESVEYPLHGALCTAVLI